jgi:uncharacterized membrane protein HdeD (DUF308 family)
VERDEVTTTREGEKTEREERSVWWILPVIAVIGGILAIVSGVLPADAGPWLFGVAVIVAVVIGGVLLARGGNQMRRNRGL